MPQGHNGTPETIRPVFLVDRGTYQSYASYIRRILVGLSGTAHASMLVCPACVNAETILCPAVERVEHPALRLPIFHYQNRRILLERLSRFKPTILHAFYPGQVHLADWLSQQLQIPYVLTFHRHGSRWLQVEKSIRNASRIIAPSEAIAGRLCEDFSKLSEGIERIHVGTFLEDSCRCFSVPGRIASLIAIHPLDNVAVFEPLLGAVRHLVLDGFELMVAIMGKGRKEKLIRRRIRQLGLTSAVTIVPPMSPVRSILAGADIYLHLEDTGQFDGRLLEAMGVGLAVAGCAETSSGLVYDGQTAALWDGADELSIYGCLKKLLGQRAETRQLAMNGQKHLRQHNSVSRMVDKLIETYVAAQQEYRQRHKELEEEPVFIQ
ncbi:MAG: glycosyltransferase family 4 protein [Planctomycetes bacterium]|nr:glycosyltransferase family 4 protein [Planctomycetota bacterium]